MRPFNKITTRHPLWKKLPMNLHTPTTSQSWVPITDTGWSLLIRNPAYSQPLIAPWKILLHASSLWPCLFSRYLPEEDGADPRRVSRMHWNCRQHHSPQAYQSRTLWPSPEPHVCCLQIWVSVQPTKTHVKAPAVNFFGCLYGAGGVQPDPDKVNAVHTLPVPTNVTELQEFLGMVMYLCSFIPGLSTLTTPLCKLLKKERDFT